MSYKTILVHLTDERRARSSLAFASRLAGKFDAHLIGLYAFPAFRLTPPVPLPFGGEVVGQIRAALREDVESVKSVFDDVTARQPFVAEWRSITTERRPADQVVLEHARAADLVIASQTDSGWKWSDILDFPETLAVGAGRPVLVVPNFGRFEQVPRLITIAWNGSREAARAVADAMPLLRLAELVNVLCVREGGPLREGHLPDAEIAASLARHGVKVDFAEIIATEYTVGEEIRVRAIDRGSDLMVMGCYGHSRFREMALGGVTRHMLREMTMPVLFSH